MPVVLGDGLWWDQSIKFLGSQISKDRPMRTFRLPRLSVLTLQMLLFGVPLAGAQEAATEAGTDIGTLYRDEVAPLYKPPGYSPYVGRNYPTRVLWGDTHLHTANSLDAAAFGNTLGPEPAYRFARGEEVMSSSGQVVRFSRPLDFLVIADHAEFLGSIGEIKKGNPKLLTDPIVRRWRDLMAAGGQNGVQAVSEMLQAFGAGNMPKALTSIQLARSVWQDYTGIAEHFNEPGRFTALIGYEWTSQNSGNNVHRVVVFRDGKEKADQTLPFSALDSEDPAMLWKFLDNYTEKTGGEVLAIPHNGNLSNGRMFALTDFAGRGLTRAYAETRARLEPVYEVTQIKGDGEAHGFLSPNDEFAGFEVWDKGNLDLSDLKKPEMLQYEYARSALKLGLRLEQELGVNPFKFGMIGSTDAHTSLATADQDNFFGKHSGAEPGPTRATHEFLVSRDGSAKIMGWEQVASGYAAVWATDNTRAAIFDALERKEVYASTGPRMIVRFFGGFDLRPATQRPGAPPSPVILAACRWAAISRRRRRARRRTSWWQRSRTRSAPISTASRSSRAGRTKVARCRRRSTTSPGGMLRNASPMRRESCPRSATPSTYPTPPGPTRSAIPN